MAKLSKQKIIIACWLVVALAASGILDIVYVGINTVTAVAGVVFLAQALAAAGLLFHWFSISSVRPGIVIKVALYVSGFFGILAVFDLAMRVSKKAPWMAESQSLLALNAAVILLWILWIAISHYAEEDMRERKVCEFC